MIQVMIGILQKRKRDRKIETLLIALAGSCQENEYQMSATHLHRLHGVIPIVVDRVPFAFYARVSETSDVDHITVVESNEYGEDTCGRMHWLL